MLCVKSTNDPGFMCNLMFAYLSKQASFVETGASLQSLSLFDAALCAEDNGIMHYLDY